MEVRMVKIVGSSFLSSQNYHMCIPSLFKSLPLHEKCKTNEKSLRKEVGCKQNTPAGLYLQVCVPVSATVVDSCSSSSRFATQLCCRNLFQLRWKCLCDLPASWNVLIKSSLEQTGLASGWWQQLRQLFFRKKGRRDHDRGEENLCKASWARFSHHRSDIWECWFVKTSSLEWKVIYCCHGSDSFNVQYATQWHWNNRSRMKRTAQTS